MSNDRPSLMVTSAVFLGSVILVGVPTMIGSLWVFGELLAAVNHAWIMSSTAGGLLVLAIAILVGLQLAVEAAALQLGGIAALSRGSRLATVARYTILSGGTLLALTAVLGVGISVAFTVGGAEALALGLLVSLVTLGVLYRSFRAFVDGMDVDLTASH